MNGFPSKIFLLVVLIIFYVQVSNCLSCDPCNPLSCNEPTCGGGTVRDSCGCCKICAKLESESCGGMFDLEGVCDKNLTCAFQLNKGDSITDTRNEIGICKPSSSLTVSEKCHESNFHGCDLMNGNCDCGRHLACTNPFHFDSKESCLNQLQVNVALREECKNVQCTLHHSPSCPTDSQLVEGYIPSGECCPIPSKCKCRKEQCAYTMCHSGKTRILVSPGTNEPGSCCDIYQCVSQGNGKDCADTYCPPLSSITCPSDSIAVRDLHTSNKCCPGKPICQCRKSKCRRPPECAHGRAKVAFRGNENPGSCCDEYICSESKVLIGCSVNGTRYEHGSYYQRDKCTFCECLSGLSHCTQKSCPAIKCTHIALEEGGCCPVCLDDIPDPSPTHSPGPCVINNGSQTFAYGETWSLDGCTHCVCGDGGIEQCKAAFCNVGVSSCPSLLECALKDGDCPYGYDYDESVCRTCHCQLDIFGCLPLSNCQITCPYGFVVDRSGCDMCQCRQTRCKELPSSCQKQCPYGYKPNKVNCDRCKCRPCPSMNSCTKQCELGLAENKYGCKICKCKADNINATQNTVSPQPTHMCTDPITGNRYDDGETWSGDYCHICLCRGGEVMCDVIRCPTISCENPILREDDCCPVCNDTDEQNLSLLSCRGQKGKWFVEAEIWEVDQCTTCTCHNSHMMCTSLVCPPVTCDHPVYDDKQCCMLCDELPVPSSQLGLCHSDNGSLLEDGNEFKRDACTSCTCRKGVIKCFNESCSDAPCSVQVLMRGQCCPSCFGMESDSPSLRSCLKGDGTRVSDGEKWNDTKNECLTCMCVNGSVRCYEPECPPISDMCRRTHRQIGMCCEKCVWMKTDIPTSVSNPPGINSNNQTLAIALTITFLVLLVFVFFAVAWWLIKKNCPKHLKYTRGNRNKETNTHLLEIRSNGTNSIGCKSSGTGRSDMTTFSCSDEEKSGRSLNESAHHSHATSSVSSNEEKSRN